MFGNNDLLRGALIGGTEQSVGQVVASATMVNPNTTTLATLFKIMRIIMLVFVVLYFGFRSKKQKRNEQGPTQIKIKRNSFSLSKFFFTLVCSWFLSALYFRYIDSFCAGSFSYRKISIRLVWNHCLSCYWFTTKFGWIYKSRKKITDLWFIYFSLSSSSCTYFNKPFNQIIRIKTIIKSLNQRFSDFFVLIIIS